MEKFNEIDLTTEDDLTAGTQFLGKWGCGERSFL